MSSLSLPQFRELVLSHEPPTHGELREILNLAVQFHVENVHQVDAETEAGPMMEVTPCILIAMAYEILVRRMMTGELTVPRDPGEVIQ